MIRVKLICRSSVVDNQGKSPIRIRLTLSRRTREITIAGAKASYKDWDNKTESIKGDRMLTLRIKKIKSDYEAMISKCVVIGNNISMDELVKAVANGGRYVKKLACRYSDDSNDNMPVFRITEDATIDYIGDHSWEEIQELTDKRYGSVNQTEIVEFLAENCDSTVQQLESKFVSTQKMSRSTMFDNLSKLQDQGEISRPKTGVYRHKDCHDLQNLEQSSDNDDKDLVPHDEDQ